MHLDQVGQHGAEAGARQRIEQARSRRLS